MKDRDCPLLKSSIDDKERRRRLAQVYKLILSWFAPDVERYERTKLSNNQDCLSSNENAKPAGDAADLAQMENPQGNGESP